MEKILTKCDSRVIMYIVYCYLLHKQGREKYKIFLNGGYTYGTNRRNHQI